MNLSSFYCVCVKLKCANLCITFFKTQQTKALLYRLVDKSGAGVYCCWVGGLYCQKYWWSDYMNCLKYIHSINKERMDHGNSLRNISKCKNFSFMKGIIYLFIF